MAAGLYIHIPFCFSKCPYCDFYSTKYTPTAADAFAEKLGGQMQDYTGSFDTVYFGGGTPSILEPQVLTGILQAVRDHFTIDPAAEITVECNPSKDLTRDMEQYAAAGINRVSIGMQSAVDQERFALGRRAGSGEVARTVAAAKAAGITNISLDVMLGTPKQTPDSLEETFAFIARMQVTHISAYLLKIEPGTPFDRLQAQAGAAGGGHRVPNVPANGGAAGTTGLCPVRDQQLCPPGVRKPPQLEILAAGAVLGAGAQRPLPVER